MRKELVRARLGTRALLSASAAMLIFTGAPAFAQDAFGEIIVTARKRDETSIAVPVVVSAVGSAELQQRAVSNLDGIARLVPQLIIAPQGGSVQGGNIAIRGISGPDTNPFGDQAVSFNIDGVQVAKASVRRMSDVDIAQVEVLKGPQALFYGKNSPAGIVSIRTADPTPEFEAKVSAGYEFVGREWRGEGYVSTPITDTLGIRVAGFVSDMNGYLKNQVPADAYLYSVSDKRTPKARDYAGRVTLKWDPSDRFSARLKVNYSQTKQNGPAGTVQYISCPQGAPQSGAIDDCRGNKNIMYPGFGAAMDFHPIFSKFDGENHLKQDQVLAGLELDYALSDEVQLISVSGLYYQKALIAQNYEGDYAIVLPSTNNLKNREFSQELRLQTSYDGPLNFTAGLFFSSTRASTGSNTYVYAAEQSGLASLAANGLDFIPLRAPFQINHYQLRQLGTAYSAFMQMAYNPIETVEINVGGRYSYEKKRVPFVRDNANGANPFGYNPLTAADDVFLDPVRDSWNDFSPEVTVSYRPNSDLTLFGSYKHGFLSGGFNSSSVDFRAEPDISYDPQTIKGFEAGAKALLFNSLRLNFAAYTYKVSDLQVTNFTNATNTIRNAGAVKIKGAEFDFNYRTPVDGLSVNGAVAFNDGKYSSFPSAPCYNGQTPAMGCFLDGAGNPSQDLGDSELIRAPKWNLSGSVNYETPLGSDFKLGMIVAANYSSSYLTDATSNPYGRMPKYALLDATLRFGDVADQWELAVIGRNLTNKYYWAATPNVPFTGSGTGTMAGVLGDVYGSMSRGREVMLRVSYKFGG